MRSQKLGELSKLHKAIGGKQDPVGKISEEGRLSQASFERQECKYKKRIGREVAFPEHLPHEQHVI